MAYALFRSKTVIGILITIAALIAFNLTGTGIKPEQQAIFEKWYAEASPPLHSSIDGTYTGKEITVGISTFTAGNPSAAREWKLPKNPLTQSEERSRMARVLQLISASEIFRRSGVTSPRNGVAYLSITITEPAQKFEVTVAYDEVKENIQLQNLLKLLEVFSTTPAAVTDVPTQL